VIVLYWPGSLTSVGSFVHIWRNHDLESLGGLGSLASVGSHLIISLGHVLKSFAALSKLTYVTIPARTILLCYAVAAKHQSGERLLPKIRASDPN